MSTTLTEAAAASLMQAHRALCSPFIEEAGFRAAMGAPRSDLGAIAAYLRLPVHKRPALTPFFDRLFYTLTNPDVHAAGLDPLLHFLGPGLAALRAPHPLIDLRFITSQDKHALGRPPAITALLDLLEYDLLPPSPYFDPAWYRDTLSIDAPEHGLLRHYLATGLPEGRPPNPHLDPAWYAAQHDDVAPDPYGALRHFVLLGDPEGRAAGPGFDGTLYRARYPDVARTRVPPLAHFLTHGAHEGRQPVGTRPTHIRSTEAATAGQPLPFDRVRAQQNDAELRQRLSLAHTARLTAVAPITPPLVTTRDPARDLAKLRFASPDAPRVTVLIPVFNEFATTVECLVALSRARTALAFDVVIADDASTDPAMATLAVPGVALIRQPANAGFLRNCNAAFAACRGDYVLILNNDTQLQRGAIDRLAAALDADTGIAAAGPKLIYPNGRLQEAGCALTATGESVMVGLGENPADPGYNFARDVAYCSGAALLVRRAAVDGPLFDEAYAPAYCEDADLCLRVIAAGHRVRYVPEAVVVHHLSVSTNRQAAPAKSRQIIRNQARLHARWPGELAALQRVRTLAFYLPQFHPTPHNDLWWGPGFTEWTNVARARPSYAGHYQPHLPADLGFYDLRAAETLTAQAQLAARYGVEGFCAYYYNFDGTPLLSRPLDTVRADPAIPFHWCLCWANENWTKHWDGGEREIIYAQRYDDATLAAIIADAVAHAADPRYFRIDGAPLFLVYRPLLLPDPPAFAAACRAAFAAAGHPGLHLVYVEGMEATHHPHDPASIGFDAAVEFPPQGLAARATTPAEALKEGWAGFRYDYPETVAAFLARPTVAWPRYPAVFPSWDNTPRQPLAGTSFDNASPEAFRVYVAAQAARARRMLMGEHRLLFVNAWNEWAEGAHLEPDTGHGHRWLEALRDGLA